MPASDPDLPDAAVVQEPLVLLIEGDPAVRAALTSVLAAHGARVAAAAHGLQGLELLARHRFEVAAAIVDVALPFAQSRATLLGLLHLRPDLAVLLVTGHDATRVRRAMARLPHKGLLAKPFGATQLIAALDTRCGAGLGGAVDVAWPVPLEGRALPGGPDVPNAGAVAPARPSNLAAVCSVVRALAG